MSYPLRRSLIGALGGEALLGVYLLVAFSRLGATIRAYQMAETTALCRGVGEVPWAASSVLMLFASILLLGSLVRHPALTGMTIAAGTAKGGRRLSRYLPSQ